MVKEKSITVRNDASLCVSDVDRYFADRQYRKPNLTDALDFMATEVGECIDLRLQQDGGWVRNNKEKERILSLVEYQEKMGKELGDVIMMAIAAGTSIGIDPIQSLLKKMQEKVQE